MMKRKKTIWIILTLGLALRTIIPIVAVYLTPGDGSIFHNKDDTFSYLTPATGLAAQGKFVSDGRPELSRTPGYPLLLVPGILFGNVEIVTIAIQIVLSCFTILLVYGIAKVLFDDECIAVLGAGLYAIEPLSVIQTSILQTETAFAFSLTAFLFLLLRYLKNSSLTDLLGAGLVASIGAYIRPTAYFMPLLVAVFLLLKSLIRTKLRIKPLIYVCLFLLVAMLPLFGWQLRNKIETGHFVFSTIAGNALYFDAAMAILADESGTSRYDQKYKMGYFDYKRGYSDTSVYFGLHPEQKEWSEAQLDAYQQKEALKIIAAHPLQYFEIALLRTGWILLGPGLSDWLYVFNVRLERMDKVVENKKDPLRLLKGPWLGLVGTIFLAGMLAGYWILAAAGIFAGKPITEGATIFLVMIAAYFVLVTAAAGLGYSRYRHPIMPIVCLFAGNGLTMILDKWAIRRHIPNNT